VSDPIYDLPRPITRESVAAYVAENEALRQEGRAILAVNLGEAGEVAGYSHFAVWPERASGELAGARRADLQNSGQGRVGVAHSIAWMFEVLGLRLIALTAALDNVRSAKSIDGAGFKRMGEVDSVRPDGTTRRSLYWELTRDEWRMRHRL
jgi:RimJ/RimL family protein N-acetyltransferase